MDFGVFNVITEEIKYLQGFWKETGKYLFLSDCNGVQVHWVPMVDWSGIRLQILGWLTVGVRVGRLHVLVACMGFKNKDSK